MGLAETAQEVDVEGENPGFCISGKVRQTVFRQFVAVVAKVGAFVAKLYCSVKIKMFSGNMSVLTPFSKEKS